MSHTPGPWKWHPIISIGTDGRETTWYPVTNGQKLVVTADREDDAALIAAAPELLAALEAIEWLDDEIDGSEYCPYCGNTKEDGHAEDCAVGNALKKAKGE